MLFAVELAGRQGTASLAEDRWRVASQGRDIGRDIGASLPASPGHPRKDHTVLQCLHVVLKEEWQHHRYAVRDLAVLEMRRSP